MRQTSLEMGTCQYVDANDLLSSSEPTAENSSAPLRAPQASPTKRKPSTHISDAGHEGGHFSHKRREEDRCHWPRAQNGAHGGSM